MAKGDGGKVSRVMKEWKAGELHSGSKKGPKVTSQKQAVAIGLSEARKAGENEPPPPDRKAAMKAHAKRLKKRFRRPTPMPPEQKKA